MVICARINLNDFDDIYCYAAPDDGSPESELKFISGKGFYLIVKNIPNINPNEKTKRLIIQEAEDCLRFFEKTFLLSWSNRPIAEEINRLDERLSEVERNV